MQQVLGVILGGGQGSRLYPLTKLRAKPAVPLAGKYRLIDVPISNCLNSGISRMYVLTQFLSASLHRHIYQTYKFDTFGGGWVQILAAEQTPAQEGSDWYQGTADAVRKQLNHIRRARASEVLILSGDHLYRMDYGSFIATHRQCEADVSVAVQPVTREAAPALGILKTDKNGRIVEFAEKPKGKALDKMSSGEDPEKPFLASMGIYIFNSRVLQELLSGLCHKLRNIEGTLLNHSQCHISGNPHLFLEEFRHPITTKRKLPRQSQFPTVEKCQQSAPRLTCNIADRTLVLGRRPPRRKRIQTRQRCNLYRCRRRYPRFDKR